MLMSLPIIGQLRAIKSNREISYIKKAQHINEQVLWWILAQLKLGQTELAVQQIIIDRLKRHHVKALAFEPIVAFGRGTADVHHMPNKSRLRAGDTVMLDFGATINGYCSDMTRTFFFGQPTKRQIKIYEDVLRAQKLALKKLSNGQKNCGVIDKSARNFLQVKYGAKAFPHGLGHGVGTAIHEWPTFKPTSPDRLKPNMVMTVEPGLYFKNWGGVRIEDMVLITKTGTTNLTHYPKNLKSAILKVK